MGVCRSPRRYSTIVSQQCVSSQEPGRRGLHEAAAGLFRTESERAYGVGWRWLAAVRAQTIN